MWYFVCHRRHKKLYVPLIHSASSFVDEMRLLVFIDLIYIDSTYIDTYNTDITF